MEVEQTMNEKKQFLVQVDAHKRWTPGTYRVVTKEELDDLLSHYGGTILRLVSNGERGAMAMWACFKSNINGGCYGDMINAYRLLTDDSRSLVDREHELRHLWYQYEELWRIRYYGTVEAYHLKRAAEAKEHYDKYAPKEVQEIGSKMF